MSEDRNSYSSIVKSIGLFGGVKVFQIIVGIIKNKLVALILGPEGMGISGMITTSTGMISSLTGIGLQTSSVIDIAKAHESNNPQKIVYISTILRKLVVLTGLIGTIITFLMAPWLSVWAFGNHDFVWAFRIVSVILFLDQLCVGQIALLQGTFHYRMLAKSQLYSSIAGAVTCIPVYYFWGVEGIVPVIILTSLINLLFSWLYSRRLSIKNISLSLKDSLKGGAAMIKLGLAYAITGSFSMAQVYLLRVYIANTGSMEDVGLYTAGSLIATQYINVILTSMGTDYSPRLAALSSNNVDFIDAVNKQTMLLVAIVSPLLVPFVVFVKELTVLLYSELFLPVSGMIEWMMLGMFFRTTSWCLSYTIAARGEAKKYLLNESVSILYSLFFSIVGFRIGGFVGLGIGFFMTYFVYTIHMFFLCKGLYGFSYHKNTALLSIMMFILLTIMFVVLHCSDNHLVRYSGGAISFLIIGTISFYSLNRMMPIRQRLTGVINKYRKG